MTLTKRIEQISSSFTEIAIIDKELIGSEAEVLEALLSKIKPVMRHIDKRIKTANSYLVGCDYGEENEYLDEHGITLFDCFGRTQTGELESVFDGEQLVFTRSGKLIELTRSGDYEIWEGEKCAWKSHLREMTVLEVAEEYHLAELVDSITEAMNEAIKATETKKRTLSSRLEKINEVKEILK